MPRKIVVSFKCGSPHQRPYSSRSLPNSRTEKAGSSHAVKEMARFASLCWTTRNFRVQTLKRPGGVCLSRKMSSPSLRCALTFWREACFSMVIILDPNRRRNDGARTIYNYRFPASECFGILQDNAGSGFEAFPNGDGRGGNWLSCQTAEWRVYIRLALRRQLCRATACRASS
jgi:hypothetical protein